jgi:hypothetical protein
MVGMATGKTADLGSHLSFCFYARRELSKKNGCLQQIAANRFSTPQDVIAILLQGFVLPLMQSCGHEAAHPLRSVAHPQRQQ